MIPGRDLSEDIDAMRNVRSITRGGVTVEFGQALADHVPVATGGMCAPMVLPYKSAEITYVLPCHYCRARIELDSRHRCQNCGAPEYLAASTEWSVPFLVVLEGHSQNPGPK